MFDSTCNSMVYVWQKVAMTTFKIYFLDEKGHAQHVTVDVDGDSVAVFYDGPRTEWCLQEVERITDETAKYGQCRVGTG